MPDYGHELEFGVFVTPAAESADAVVALAVLADRLGLDLVSFQDHPYQARFLDTWTLLSFAAARTARIRLAPNVLNLPLRPPSVVARAAASLDRLSGGRVELGLGAGAFWEGIAAMGGRRLRPGESVEALEEAIDVIRALWAVDEPGAARVEGRFHRVAGAHRGPAPVHPIRIWVGAYRPRMLALTGRKADGWLPSAPYLQPGDLARGNAAIDAAAEEAGRDPHAVRRLLNVPAAAEVGQLAAWAVEDGISSFVVMGDDSRTIEAFAAETAPAVREAVAAARAGTRVERARPRVALPEPTADDVRVGAELPWDEATRPHLEPGQVEYGERGRLVGQHLIDVHDLLRKELDELRDVLRQVRDGALAAGEARAALNETALRRNDWTLGAFCSRYCAVVTGHHGLEDESIFPHLARSDPRLEPVIERLTEEHLVIHDAIQAVDLALVEHIRAGQDYEPIQRAIDLLTDALLSHLAYEERELVEPLARLGFYPGQVGRPPSS